MSEGDTDPMIEAALTAASVSICGLSVGRCEALCQGCVRKASRVLCGYLTARANQVGGSGSPVSEAAKNAMMVEVAAIQSITNKMLGVAPA